MPDGGRGAPTGNELSLVDDNSYDAPPDTQILLLMQTQQQHAQARQRKCASCLSKKDDRIASLIMQVSELSSQLTTAMQWLFQDTAGLPPVPTPVAGQTRVRGLHPQQLPPAARSLLQLLQEGPYTRHEDNANHADVLPVTPVHPELRPPPLPQPPAQDTSAVATNATCTCKEQALGQAAHDVISSNNSGQ
ncbi:hypothetical protein BC830DRAFT_1175689 [Chytriomyces sp. MP71]|nr:hypothetical protein BC830DRAFT_1175689 [Chytriomyces sp. MP71]